MPHLLTATIPEDKTQEVIDFLNGLQIKPSILLKKDCRGRVLGFNDTICKVSSDCQCNGWYFLPIQVRGTYMRVTKEHQLDLPEGAYFNPNTKQVLPFPFPQQEGKFFPQVTLVGPTGIESPAVVTQQVLDHDPDSYSGYVWSILLELL